MRLTKSSVATRACALALPRADGIPTQLIAPYSFSHLPLIDLSNLPANQREEEARALCAVESERPFSLSTGPLVRMLLVKIADQEHALLLVMHHIISDGWSMNVFSKELVTLYSNVRRNRLPR